MFGLRTTVLAAVALLLAVQGSAAVYCCPKTEDSLDHPPKNMNFQSAEYQTEAVEYTEDENPPTETVLTCRYENNITCVFRTNGEVKTVNHSMCHSAATNVADADAASNSYCAKKK